MSDACCAPSALPEDVSGETPRRLYEVREIQLAVVAGFALAAGLILDAAGAPQAVQIALFSGAILAGGLTFVPEAARNLPRGQLGVGTLMAIAAVGATILGEWAEAATLCFLFSVSEALESYALTRTRRGLRALLDLVPARATVLRDGSELQVDPAELQIGDRLVVRPGERLATDGIIRAGHSALDFSAITGESVPVERGPGQEVFAAAINGGAALEVEVTAPTADNSLARIVRIVEEAQERKGHSQRLAERIARPLVPGVLVVALAIAVIGSLLGDPTTWIERALVVLVAAAPCAFAISVPVTVVAAIGAATRSGVLIKGGAALEALAGIRAVAFDKTGTLTRNRPEVIDVVGAGGVDKDELLRLAAALERRSDHPLAQAIIAAAGPGPAADGVEAHAGSGLEGMLDGRRLRLGRPGFVAAGPLARRVGDLQAAGATVVLLGEADELLGAIAVRDELRLEAAEAVGALDALGIRTAMLTGDNGRTAKALAEQVGIDSVYADLMPTDKVTAVERLQAEAPTAMVGDGINDAPALASADAGVAMGAIGTDVAIEAADVALMGDDLRILPDTLLHARRAGRVMRQNLFLSGGILLTLIPLAAIGVLGLAAVVAIHELAEVVVIANGVRAGRRKAFVQHPALAALPAPASTPAVKPPAPIELPLLVGSGGIAAEREDDCCGDGDCCTDE
ncbi:MAG: cadmium-translocating P-type ATPase [Actinobacteria bacterium]|nr:cadmium-translocating P-type ATPase [Actinomycetota bacterium]OJU86133.1 MAG: cadmium-translocating P-type ATPase [Solirubrobacterales bacterium 70-9]